MVPTRSADPWAPLVTEVIVSGRSPSGSVSLDRSDAVEMSSGTSSVTVTASGWGRGRRLAAVTSTVTVAVSVPPLPSDTVYSKVSVPLKPDAGVYVQSPPAVQETVPPPAEKASNADTVSVSPSMSVSFTKTFVVTATSSSVAASSSLPTGSSFTAVTVTVTVASSHSDGTPSSQIRYRKLVVPLQSAGGVYVKVPSRLSVTVP